MSSNSVNRQKQPDRIISIRMSQREFRALKETLKNFGIQKPGLSAEVRALFSRDLHSSRRYARSLKQINRQIAQRKRAFYQAPVEEDPEAEETEDSPVVVVE